MNISKDWEQIQKQLDYTEAPPFAKTLNIETENIKQMNRLRVLSAYKENSKLLKDAIANYINNKKSDEQKLGELTLEMDILRKRLVDEKETDQFKNISEQDKKSALHRRLITLLNTFGINEDKKKKRSTSSPI